MPDVNMLGSGDHDGGEHLIGIAGVLAPLVERWRMIATSMIGTAVLAVSVVLLWPRSYEAVVTVATISSNQGLSLGGVGSLLTGGLGGLNSGGVQASPGLVSNLMQSRRVLSAVGVLPAPGGGRVADQLAGKPVRDIDLARIVKRTLRVRVSPQTGLLQVQVAARDSALTRMIVSAIIDQTSGAFSATTRGQASQLRKAQESRVDSASRRLARAEEDLMEFLSTNRSFLPYSRQALQKQGLERAQTVAQEVYMKAVADRESAVAKELEITPAIVVVDPAPPTLGFESRHLAIIAVLAAATGFLVAVALVLLGETMRREQRGHDQDSERLNRALGTVPVVGKLMRGRA